MCRSKIDCVCGKDRVVNFTGEIAAGHKRRHWVDAGCDAELEFVPVDGVDLILVIVSCMACEVQGRPPLITGSDIDLMDR